MDHERPDRVRPDEVRAFVEEVLRSGLMLSDLLARLHDDLAEDAFGGEDRMEVLLRMLSGTIQPAADAAGARTVREAKVLLGAVRDRTLSDLRRAAELAEGS